MKTLYLLRHAKSDWETDFSTDHERGLSPRGIDASHKIAEYWNQFGFHCDLCYHSDAKRSVLTWEIISEKHSFAKKVEIQPAIYEANGDALFEIIRSAPDDCQSLLVIGHHPGLEELAELLILGDDSEDLHNPLFTKFPTAAFLGISLSVENWRDVSPGHASITVFWIPGRKGR
ncbi:SixA phosphatase family protein [Leptospira sp. GIMC2001]|uniref:SixA phosphatase family protein n=1 Tax=Leptospira sp. GIMC2001 TaxID=1513297 RepID=UPI0023492E75|nr:histidine phosphatase family protein [Leptospira sp. GIMC2001]WCL50333.1 histidine phosphatase family protein [Leptospira sp. GIMC2001]